MNISNTSINRPIKVLQLGSPTGLYGAERWILALIKHLDPQKVTSIVGVIKDDPNQDAPLCQEAEKLGIQTQFFEGHGRVNFSVIKHLKQFILQNAIDILHTHFYKTDIIGFLATRGTPCKIISTPHGWSKKMDFKLWCYETLDRMVFPFLDAVAPLSEDLYSPLTKMPGLKRKLHFIRNGVDLSEIIQSSSIDSDILKKKREGKFILGYIGQLIPRKGIDTLFNALQEVQDIDWELYLVGDGPQKEELEALANQLRIADKIHFVGFRQERLEFLRGFDVFVLPSRLEGIPRCLMESMAAGVPIIASNIPGCNDLIRNHETGLLFEADNSLILSGIIKEMATSQDLRAVLATNAKAHVNQHYSAARMAKEYESLFNKMLCT